MRTLERYPPITWGLYSGWKFEDWTLNEAKLYIVTRDWLWSWHSRMITLLNAVMNISFIKCSIFKFSTTIESSCYRRQWCTPPFSTKIGGGVAKNPAAAAFGGVASFFHRKLFIENNIDVYMYHSWIPHWHTALSTCNYKLTMKPGVWCPAWYKSN